MVKQLDFDLIDFDPEATDFDLEILATTVMQQAITVHLPQIAGAIDPDFLIVWQDSEGFVRGLFVVPIAEGNVTALYGYLADFSGSDFVPLLIHQHDIHAFYRITDRDYVLLDIGFWTDGEIADGTRLGRSETGIELNIPGEDLAGQRNVTGQDTFTAKYHQPDIENVIRPGVAFGKFTK